MISLSLIFLIQIRMNSIRNILMCQTVTQAHDENTILYFALQS